MSKGDVVARRWRLDRLLGAGSFGQVYQATDLTTRRRYAVKIESARDGSLRTEAAVYTALHDAAHVHGFPRAVFWGEHGRAKQALVMDLLGTSLRTQRVKYGHLTPASVLKIALQLVRRLESVHAVGWLHRDVKPANCVVGRKDEGVVYLLDFGVSKRYRTGDRAHIPPKRGKRLVGTVSFASLNAHRGRELGRRDDLESLVYTLVYLRKGTLPWYWVGGDDEERVGKLKADARPSVLCDSIPAVGKVLRYARSLSFAQAPDYAKVRTMLRRGLRDMGASEDGKFEWT